jgi:hypothetical protein
LKYAFFAASARRRRSGSGSLLRVDLPLEPRMNASRTGQLRVGSTSTRSASASFTSTTRRSCARRRPARVGTPE